MLRRELAKWIGLSRRDSVPNLTGRLEARLDTWSELADDLVEIRRRASAPAPASTRPVAHLSMSRGDQAERKQKTELDTAKARKFDTAKARNVDVRPAGGT